MLDELFRVLADEHRRRLLVALLEHNPQSDSEVRVPEDVHLGKMELEQLQYRMFHVHLPKLEQERFIEWDRENHQVVKGPQFEDIKPVLECLQERADELPGEWSKPKPPTDP